MSDAFTLTDKHITLLRRAYVRWDDTEAGAPAIDSKRPYGNSDVAADVVNILFGDIPEAAVESLYDYAMQLHNETKTALQIVLATGSFTPGRYIRVSAYSNDWQLS